MHRTLIRSISSSWAGLVLLFGLSAPCWAVDVQTPEAMTRFLTQQQARAGGVQKVESPLLILVSLSMPSSSLVPLMRQAHELGAPVYIQGVLPSGFKATVQKINQLLQAQGEAPIGGISIDPHPFKTWGVTRVPTYILQDQGRVDRLTGNVTPRAALQQFALSGENAALARTLSKR
ncbi:type-F conjugative transfer system pilin assembly protein TrbC [Vibrio artabrorum]|uniref:type-F conjugative transfer system pilin assembly protein TrbC n=1 Tax=Vibrio artabrorum TaxID=446374 RepID=UPI00354F8131